MKKLSIIILLCCSNYLISQNLNDLRNERFILLDDKVALSASDIEKINHTNFDNYCLFGIRKKIQIERGPLIELLSIKELEEKGVFLSKSLVDIAKSKSETFKHETILNLEIGLGVVNINPKN